MIASFEHKFIFVKGRKVASTSIEIALSPFCGPSDIVTPITPADELERVAIGGKCQNYCNDTALENEYINLVRAKNFKEALQTGVHNPKVSNFYNHMPLKQIEEKLDIPFNQYTVIISERNPYAKIISYANMQISFGAYGGEVMKNPLPEIQKRINDLFYSGEFRQVRNIDLYRTKNKYQNFILLRQERLEIDLEKLFSKFGFGSNFKSWPHAKKGILSHHIDPKAVFTRKQLGVVNEYFSIEFEMFGYPKV